jgi:uncharacterized protein YidB (DUF937 family)
MGLLNDLAEGVLGSVLQNASQAQGLQSGLTDLLNQAGGIQGLAEKFQRGGLGEIVSSWIGTGANEPISGEQLREVIGTEAIGTMASKLGFDSNQTASELAKLLPAVIDKLTPNGQVPEQLDLSQVLTSLFKR